jgi:amino acid adenylation domain-containing protein/non-ribosomal peptide synthase protein (TIGR01720 family)
VQKHEILRTVYRRPLGMRFPLQYVLEHMPVDMQTCPVSSAAEADSFLQMWGQQRFDLQQGPVTRLLVLQLDEEEHLLALSQSAWVGDRRSLVNTMQALLLGYEGLAQTAATPSTVPVQYADVAEWMAQLPEDEQAGLGLVYWQNQLRPNDVPLSIVLEHQTTPDDHGYPQRLRFSLSSPVVDFLRQQQTQGTDESQAWLLTCWQALLCRLSGQDSFKVAVEFSGRDYEELESAIGLFSRYLPVITEVDHRAFHEQVSANRAALAEASQWQHYATQVYQGGTYGTAEAQYFPIGFEWVAVSPQFQSRSLTISWVDLFSYTDHFHLLLVCNSPDQSGDFELIYDPTRFECSTIERIGQMFQTLTQSALERPHERSTALQILGTKEQQTLLNWSNGGDLPSVTTQTVLELIHAQVNVCPRQMAVCDEEIQLSYGELWQQSINLADWLRQQGIKAEVLVGICIRRSPSALVAILGIFLAGGAYVPIDPSYPAERQQFLIQDSQVALILAYSRSDHLLSLSDTKVIYLEEMTEQLGRKNAPAPLPSVFADSLAYIIYTSGSTGQPKGIQVSHANLHASIQARFAIYPQPVGRYLLLSSLAFDSSVAGIFWTLCQGGTLVLPPEGLERDIPALGELIAQTGVTHTLAVPGLYQLLLESCLTDKLRSLQTVIVAGDHCPANLLTLHRTKLPDADFYNEYGPTEGTVWCTVYRAEEPLPSAVPIGQPIPGASVFVLDAELQLAPIRVPGEIYISGAGLTRGYWQRPELQADRFLPHPLSPIPGDRLYYTGDRGRWLLDGTLEFLGRTDNQIKLHGYRIELGEIEAKLETHPGVQRAVVLLRDDRAVGGSLVGYIVPQPQYHLDAAQLRASLALELPEWMVPATFVTLETFPLTPNGKVNRNALLPPAAYAETSQPAYREPQNALEKTLAQIWSEVLQVERVSLDDNFFSLGGDSLLSLQIVTRAKQAGLGLTSRLIFQYPTIAELAPHTQVVESSAPPPRPVTTANGRFPLTPIQQWFFARNLAQPHHYNQSVLLEVLQPMEPELLKQAIHTVIARHDALRLRFVSQGRWWQESVVTESNSVFFWFDVQQYAAAEQLQILHSEIDQLHRRINIHTGLLVQVAYFRCGSDQPDRLAWVIHHLAVDAVSWRLLIEEVEAIYRSLVNGKPIKLPVPGSFQSWVTKLTQKVEIDSIQAQRQFWQNLIQFPSFSVPLDHPSASNQEVDAQKVTVRLSAASTRQLLHVLPQARASNINDILLASLGITLARWGGDDQVRIDCERHGRQDELSSMAEAGTVGWFTVIHPVLLKLGQLNDEKQAFRAALAQLAEIPDHGFAYSLLRYPPSGTPSLSDPVNGEVMFNYLGQLDMGTAASEFFVLAEESIGQDRHPSVTRSHKLEIDAEVRHAQLTVIWHYSQALHDRETIERQAQAHLSLLETALQGI